jgi:hypothetical protein
VLGHLDLVRHEDLYDSGTKTLIPTIWMVVDKIKKASMSHVEKRRGRKAVETRNG